MGFWHCSICPLYVEIKNCGIMKWNCGQITLTGDVIGSGGGTMRYEATMVFRDPAMKLLWSYRHKTEYNPHFMDFMPEFYRGTPLVHCDVIGSGSKTEHVTGIVMSTPCTRPTYISLTRQGMTDKALEHQVRRSLRRHRSTRFWNDTLFFLVVN